MQWEEGIRFAWWALSIEKVKAVLTMLGITIGSAAIVLVVTIASTGRLYVMSLIEGIGSNLVYVTLDRSGVTLPQDELTLEDLAAIQQLPRTAAAAGMFDMPVEIRLPQRTVHSKIVAVTERFQQIRKLRILAGRYFDSQDYIAQDHVCLVTREMGESVYGSGDPVGNTLRVGEFRCTVIGVFEEGVPTFGRAEIQDRTIVLPYPLVYGLTGERFLQVIYAQADSASGVQELTDDMRQTLRNRHRPEAKYSVENLAGLLVTANNVSLALTATLLSLAVLTLIVAGSGIMNIMLVNVAERTREIGVRLAVGARPAEIRFQFLMEAVFISFTGSVAGVLLAIGIIWSAARLHEAVSVSWMGVILALFVSTGIGVLFGYRPASEAAKLHPVDALRSA